MATFYCGFPWDWKVLQCEMHRTIESRGQLNEVKPNLAWPLYLRSVSLNLSTSFQHAHIRPCLHLDDANNHNRRCVSEAPDLFIFVRLGSAKSASLPLPLPCNSVRFGIDFGD